MLGYLSAATHYIRRPTSHKKNKKTLRLEKGTRNAGARKKAARAWKKEEKILNIVQAARNRACSNCRGAADVHHAKHDKSQLSCKPRAIELALIAEAQPTIKQSLNLKSNCFSPIQIRENPIRNMDYLLREMKNSITFAVEIITINILQT